MNAKKSEIRKEVVELAESLLADLRKEGNMRVLPYLIKELRDHLKAGEREGD